MRVKRRTRYGDNAYMAVIASLEREGRIQKQVRRCFVAHGGKPLTSPDFLPWAYPQLAEYKLWHRWSVRRALQKYAVPIGYCGRATLWAPRKLFQ
jgi:hypothetical protein